MWLHHRSSFKLSEAEASDQLVIVITQFGRMARRFLSLIHQPE